MHRIVPALALSVLVPAATWGQAPKPKDIPLSAHWIYDDVPAALAKARETNKPILALFR